MMQEIMDASEVKKLLSGGYVGPRPAPYALESSIEIELPMPPQATHPNARPSWKAKAKAVKRQREDAFTMASVVLRGKGPPLWERVTIQATFHKPGKQAKLADQDGLISWCKASVDGLQGTVIKNDSGVTWLPPVQVIGEAAEERKLVLVITSRDEP